MKKFISFDLIIFAGWVAVSLVAIIALFHLWFTRERAMYWGCDVRAKQEALFNYVGFPKTILDSTYKIQEIWPENMRYSMSGDLNLLSYPVYLLLPRMPVDSAPSRLVFGPNTASLDSSYRILNPEAPLDFRIAVNGVDAPSPQRSSFSSASSAPACLLSAIFSILGIAYFIGATLLMRRNISLPELFSLAILFAGIAMILSKYLFYTLTAGLVLVGVVSVLGWFLLIIGKIEKTYFLPGLVPDVDSTPSRAGHWIITCPLVIVIGMFLWSFLKTVIVGPDVWDCWAIWGAKAKMMALGAGSVSDAILTGQRDYPLLWPALWSFTGKLAGGWEDQWSKGWGPVLMLLCAAEIAVIVTRETKRPRYGLVAGAIFVSLPAVPLVASWGYAEPVLWCMVTCSFGMLLKWQKTQSLVDLAVAGLLAAGAAMTKNEGLVFACLSLVWIGINSRLGIKSILAFVLPLSVVYVPWFCLLKYVSGAQYDSMPPLVMSLKEAVRKGSHLWPSLKVAFGVWSDFRQWTFVLWGIILWTLVYLFKGSRSVRLNMMIPVLMIVASMVAIILRNENYEWQVGAAWNRLTIQALPLLIIAIACEYVKKLSSVIDKGGSCKTPLG